MITKKQVEQFFNENKDVLTNKKTAVDKLHSFVKDYEGSLEYKDWVKIKEKKEKEDDKQIKLKAKETNSFLEQKENKEILKKWSKIIKEKKIDVPFAQYLIINVGFYIEDMEPLIDYVIVSVSNKIPEKLKHDFECIADCFHDDFHDEDYLFNIIYDSDEYEKYKIEL